MGWSSQSVKQSPFVRPPGDKYFSTQKREGRDKQFVCPRDNKHVDTKGGGGAFDDVGGGDDDDVDGDDDEVDGEAEEDVSEENILAIIARKLGAGAISHRHP